MPFYKEKLKRDHQRRVYGQVTESAWYRLTKDWDELRPEFALYLTDWLEGHKAQLEAEIWLLTYAPGTRKVKGRRWLE
jgi:hypothetical protein